MIYYGSNGFKGQSAIEYLMTYGWMLLVVAVVGGAIFSIVQSQSVKSVSGFTGGDIVVDDFGLTGDGDLELLLRNTASESVEVNSVNVSDGDGFTEFVGGERISVGETRILSVSNVSGGDGSSNLDVKVNYDIGGLSNMKVSGTLSGNFEITESGSSTGNGEAGNDGAGEPFSEPSFKPPGDLSNVLVDMEGSGNSEDPYLIKDDHDLQAIKEDLDAHYVLGQNIDASGTTSWNDGAGFNPIGGGFGNELTGSLDGAGYVIDGLYINRPSTEDVGLIGRSDGDVTNIGVVNADVTGGSNVGGLVGRDGGTVEDSYSTASVNGTTLDNVGGLVGYHEGGTVSESYATGSVNGSSSTTGGLVGDNSATINSSYATGDVSGPSNVGGLFGSNGGTVSKSYATGDVSGDRKVGGLFGDNGNGGTVSESYATGDVSGDSKVGGLAGVISSGGNVEYSYSTGSVSGGDSVGGLVGQLEPGFNAGPFDLDGGNVEYSYSTGSVSGDSLVGGLVGDNSGTAEDSYWDKDSSGQSSSAGGTGLATSDMQGDSYNAGFESDIVDDSAFTGVTEDYPDLVWESE